MLKRILSGLAVAALALPLVIGTARTAVAVEIEYWQYFFEARVKAMDTLIENFEKANPDITVRMTHFPYADYRTKVAAAIPAGEGPDVVQLFYGWLNDYINAKLIQPLPTDQFPAAEIEKDFFPMVEAMKRGDAYYALPTAVRSLAMFYNTRLFEEAGISGPPTTHSELIDIAKKLTKKDGAGNLTQVGITLGMAGQDHHWFREVLVRQFGGDPYLDDYKKVNYNTPEGQAAMQFYVDLIKKHGVTAIGFMDEAQAAFKAGRAGMHIDGSFRIGALDRTRGLKWAVAELPASDSGVKANYSSYWVNGITTKASGEKYDAAVKFMKYVSSPEAMQIWLDTVGELPAMPAAALTDANKMHDKYGAFIRGLSYANTTKFANESAQRQGMVDAVNEIMLNDMSVADAVAKAATAEQAILDEYYK